MGDTIHEKTPECWSFVFDADKLGDRKVSGMRMTAPAKLDITKPDAIVTEITERGFKYEYDYPAPIGRAEWGEMAVGGEVYEEGFGMWERVER